MGLNSRRSVSGLAEVILWNQHFQYDFGYGDQCDASPRNLETADQLAAEDFANGSHEPGITLCCGIDSPHSLRPESRLDQRSRNDFDAFPIHRGRARIRHHLRLPCDLQASVPLADRCCKLEHQVIPQLLLL